MDYSFRARRAVLAGILAAFTAAPATAQDVIKIGYAISLTGPYAGGAGITTIPNYRLWAKDVNAAGGILLSSIGKRVPVELVEYDDRGSPEEAVKAVERLIQEDKVALILPPWGTRLNVAVGPTLNRLGYPHLAVTPGPEPELARKWPHASFWLGFPSDFALGFADLLTKLRAEGKIGDRVAMMNVEEPFGQGFSTAARNALREANFRIVYDKSYPTGTQDMQPFIEEAKAAKPDVFVCLSHPPETLAFTTTARVLEFNPKVFVVGVGAAFPLYKHRFGPNAEGVMGVGGWNPELPAIKDYVKRHQETFGREPDRWASPVTYASLQALQQAIERVGKIDRSAIAAEIRNGSFDTILGKVTLHDGVATRAWAIGQWQNGEFYGVAPTDMPGARPALLPKPAWKSQ